MAARRISCAHCGDTHETVAEVRTCWDRAQTHTPTEAAPTAGRAETSPRATYSHTKPRALGRNAIVSAGGAIPEAWSACATFAVDLGAAVPDDRLADRLLELAHSRTSVVFRCDADTPADEYERGSPWKLAPSFRFEGELIRHLVHTNSVDFRGPTPRFHPTEMALDLGAGPNASDETDVVLPDGTPAFCDGGPPTFLTGAELGVPGAAVLHRVALEHGSLVPFVTNASTAELAPDQMAAVTLLGGGARIIAPAGSGKTRVLTERARHLLRNWQLPGSAVCLVAFNRRAAEEMRDRTTDLPELQVRTLNSLALAILNGTPPFRPRGVRLRTIDETEVRNLLAKLVDLPRRVSTDPAAAWLEGLSAVRLGLRDPAEVEDEYGGDLDGLARVFDLYRALLADKGVLDFDEQIYGAVEALLTEPETRRATQRVCRLLLVDEFQDLTPAHVLLIRLAAGPDSAVFGVGDDDQTIYGYAGASPEWLLRFGDFFPGSAAHALTVNYRCPPAVVAGADRLLQRNQRRVPKQISPRPGRPSAPEQLQVLPVTEDANATMATAEHVRDLVDAGASPDEVAVLTRVNASLAPVQVALRRLGVPVRNVLDDAWLQRSGVRAALAWLQLAAAPERLRGADIALAARRPPRGISPRVLEWMSEQGSAAGLRALAGRLSGRDAPKIEGFARDLDQLALLTSRGRPAATVLRTLRDEVGLDRAMQSLEAARRRVDRSAHTDDLDALVELASLHPEGATFERWLREELRQPTVHDGVMLATVHSVKGREWRHVVVHAATAGLMPHRLAFDGEEERRVFHVAVTRGVETVTVVAPDPPSPFVAELFRDPVDDPRPQPRRQPVAAPPTRPAKTAANRSPSADPAASERAGVFLRQWRRDRARTDGKPAFTVLHDTTIDDIAAGLPTSFAALAEIKGIGPAKLERFGDEILAAVEQAVAPN
ncbi:MAG TPA: ATP-dependent DNA helicase UvrD2 [Acidimicrobiales bacterium]|nr:ATP-dependent DNA helicase UvrD2 [Acidimicrobiales bacterium]